VTKAFQIRHLLALIQTPAFFLHNGINHEGREEYKEFTGARRSEQVSHNCNLEDAVFLPIPAFANHAPFVNPAELFRQETDTVQLAPGDFLFREGDKRDKMYVLLEGEIDVRLGDYVVETARAGALIGEMALIDDSPRCANAVAKTPCRLAPVDQRRFHFLIQQHPHFATHVMKELAARLRNMNAAAMR
jgi:CRP-like cAMP-binding protein